MSRRGKLMGALIAAVLLGSAAFTGAAFADGDPGSDVLLAQNLFAPSTANLTVKQQLKVGALLSATAQAGAPVRVAVIPGPGALGTVTALWRKPQSYASYLGYELSDTYSGRLLVIMPDGFGVYWSAKGQAGADQMATALQHSTVLGITGSSLVSTITAAVRQVEVAAGVSQAALARYQSHSGPLGSSATSAGGDTRAAPSTAHNTGAAASTTPHKLPSGLLALVLIVLVGLYIAYRTGRLKNLRLPSRATYVKRGDREGESGQRHGLFGLGISPAALLPTGLLAGVVIVLLVAVPHGGAQASQTQLAAANPSLDTGTALAPRMAPNFTLADQDGQEVSLRQYRGKVVILSFIDAECQTVCPLTSTAMLDAKRDLGAAGKDVQLLAVNANWKSTQIDDVINYTEMHGMTGEWNFMTGSDSQLEPVWSAYHLNELRLVRSHTNNIDHLAATYLIDPQGRLRRVFLTQTAYAAIPQFGQLLAQDASDLLASHPAVQTDLSYQHVDGITPQQTTTLPKVGGGSVTLGPGKAHLYVFFATWDSQTTPLAHDLVQLNSYQHDATRDGLPPVTAIDVAGVEPNAQALPNFLRKLPHKLDYPVAVDTTGRVSDGYDVEGEPWFLLVSSSGQKIWYQEVYTQGWPGLKTIRREVKLGLEKVPGGLQSTQKVDQELADSPPALAAIHQQAGELLGGGESALYRRIRALRGYPVVVNIWASTCAPCQKEFGLFAHASAQYGRNVAFLGADNEDQASLAQAFLRQHPVSYPSYSTTTPSLEQLLIGGLEGTPTTMFFNAKGELKYVHAYEYTSQSTLDGDIGTYALGRGGCSACR